MNVDLIDILKARTEKKIKKWMIPLTDVGSLHHVYKDFWNDEVILEKSVHHFSMLIRSQMFLVNFHQMT